ncbi:hypothetical protein T484DRAFT_2091284 [Baffinella frigidus]|nr:hypothetical protein T484DRAFT_2091284 [Cryptophyta sp. CCMP2293]
MLVSIRNNRTFLSAVVACRAWLSRNQREAVSHEILRFRAWLSRRLSRAPEEASPTFSRYYPSSAQ